MRAGYRSVVGAAMVLLIAGLAVLAGCGGSSDKEAASPAGGFDSPYCVTARNWAVHELHGGGDGAYARGGPAALEKWWNDQIAYLNTSLRQAPPVIHDAEALNERAIRANTGVWEKYGFDPKRVEAEGSTSDKAVIAPPPPDVAKAQEARNLYQDEVCGYGGDPPAAKVTFKPNAAAKSYCEAVAAQERGLEKVASSGFDPEAFQLWVTSDSFTKSFDAQDATAPSEIAADVKTVNEWVRTRVVKVLEKFDYDLRRILREGSAEDLAVFTFWDPAIVKEDRRVTAYQDQVCSG